MNFIEPLKKTMPAGLKYILHLINYFSRYFMTDFSMTVNASDVIQALNNLFSQFTQSEAFFLN